MAFTTEPLLQITDSVNTVTLMDNTATTDILKRAMTYRLSFGGWGPKVAERNDNPLGLPYLPVMEEMTIDIRGANPAACYASLRVLRDLLDQADRWWNNEIVNPVLVKYLPKGSSRTTALQDVIMGGSADDRASQMVTLPDDMNYAAEVSFLKGIKVKFWRRVGTWLGESEVQSVSIVDVGNNILSVTYTDFATVLSPVQIELYPTNKVAAASTASGFILIGNTDVNWAVVEGASGVTAVSLNGPVSTNDAGQLPTNGKVGRVTTSTVQVDATINPVLMPVENCEYCAVYANVRNNDTTVNDVYLQVSVGTGKTIALPEVKIAAAASPRPAWYFLGMFPTRGRRPTQINISYRSISGTPTFDFDQVILHGVNRGSNAIAFNNMDIASPASGVPIGLLHRLLNEPQGEMSIRLPPNDVLQSYSGSIYCYTGSHGTIKKTAVAVLVTDRTNWQLANSANTAGATWNMDATRLKAYLVPE